MHLRAGSCRLASPGSAHHSRKRYDSALAGGPLLGVTRRIMDKIKDSDYASFFSANFRIGLPVASITSRVMTHSEILDM